MYVDKACLKSLGMTLSEEEKLFLCTVCLLSDSNNLNLFENPDMEKAWEPLEEWLNLPMTVFFILARNIFNNGFHCQKRVVENLCDRLLC